MKTPTRSTSTHRFTFITATLCCCTSFAFADQNTALTPDEFLPAESLVTKTEHAPAIAETLFAQAIPNAVQVQPGELDAANKAADETAAQDEDASPYRLRRALRERDFSIGYGRKIPTSRFDGRDDVTLLQFIPRWGRFRDAHQEFLWEIPLTLATSPKTAYAAGVTLMYRYHFSSNRRFTPFVEIGSGFIFTNLHKKTAELGGPFQFSPQAGIGFRKAVGETSDLVVSARWLHYSNAGTKSPNTGLNNYLVTVGYSRLF